jgi:hypothetical protein
MRESLCSTASPTVGEPQQCRVMHILPVYPPGKARVIPRICSQTSQFSRHTHADARLEICTYTHTLRTSLGMFSDTSCRFAGPLIVSMYVGTIHTTCAHSQTPAAAAQAAVEVSAHKTTSRQALRVTSGKLFRLQWPLLEDMGHCPETPMLANPAQLAKYKEQSTRVSVGAKSFNPPWLSQHAQSGRPAGLCRSPCQAQATRTRYLDPHTHATALDCPAVLHMLLASHVSKRKHTHTTKHRMRNLIEKEYIGDT